MSYLKSGTSVINPMHYCQSGAKLQPIEVIRYLNADLGNAWKYCTRYMYKNTPGTDLGKAIWYMDDFRANWIDANDESMFIHKIPQDIVEKMIKFVDAEPRQEVKNLFNQIIIIATQNRILDTKEFDLTRYELLQFAKTFPDADLKDLE